MEAKAVDMAGNLEEMALSMPREDVEKISTGILTALVNSMFAVRAILDDPTLTDYARSFYSYNYFFDGDLESDEPGTT